jgi:AraC-like DNA-binding protein
MGNTHGPSLTTILSEASRTDEVGVSVSRFSNADLPAREQFDAFSDWFSPFLKITPTAEVGQGFAFSHATANFQKMSLVNYRRDGSLSERDANHIRRDPGEAVTFVALREGASEGQTADRDYRLRPGEILVRDTTRPYRILSSGTDVVLLSLPRDMVSALVGDPRSMDGLVFGGGLMGLLHDHMMSLVAHLDRLRSVEPSQVVGMTEHLVAAALAPSRDACFQAAAPVSDLLRRRAERYIARHLFAEDLTPDRIAVAIGVSRRRLYQLFDHTGGVARYIMGLRLDRARDMLASQHRAGLVKEVALSHGFKSEAHFCRSFKTRFDHAPSETREAARLERLGASAAIST